MSVLADIKEDASLVWDEKSHPKTPGLDFNDSLEE